MCVRVFYFGRKIQKNPAIHTPAFILRLPVRWREEKGGGWFGYVRECLCVVGGEYVCA